MKEEKKKELIRRALIAFRFWGAIWKLCCGFILIGGVLYYVWKPSLETIVTLIVAFFVIVSLFRSYALEELLKDIKEILEKKFPISPSKESVASPGYVMTGCRWATLIKENPKDGDVDIWVSCKQNLMTGDGCPENCQGYEPHPKATGQGALGGMVLGGVLGLLGGPAGVILGGLVGGLIGHGLESSASVSLENKLSKWKNLRKRATIHVIV